MSSPTIDRVARKGLQNDPRISGDRWPVMLTILAIGDMLAVIAAFMLAYLLRFYTNWPIFNEGSNEPHFYATLMVALVPSWIALFALYGLYKPHYLGGGTQEYTKVFNACTLGMVLVIILTFLVPDVVVARAWLLLAWLASVSFTILWRFSARRGIYRMRHQGWLTERVVVLGANAEGRAVATQLKAAPIAGSHIVGFVDDELDVGTEVLPDVYVLGSSTTFQQVVLQHRADAVIIADTNLVRERMSLVQGAIETLSQLNVHLSPGLFDLLTIGVQVREQANVPLLTLNKTRITGLHAFSKAILDRGGALAALIIFSPLLLLIALLVRLDSPGPLIHRRRVMGAGNRSFDAFKFRSMYVDGNTRLTPEQKQELATSGKLKEDPRVTRLGHFLRRTSLDELPQLVNVLLGQMSLVGPRMITQDELHHFGRWQHNLLMVRPGLTGLWQISGRSNLGYEDRVRLDMHYIRNYSIWLDLYIVFRTIPIVLNGHGAY
ncbi:sugar transferase [Candidatus Chloroploca sp. Khr17]|uniref:sugar transferase n=1 Tax=Candidatus Chloroploca sp. Khr17 TaxID=2496869 RepID=UPI00101C41B4|nr:sugar transferase [Candidatus Chloroploca sp. Khr17]